LEEPVVGVVDSLNPGFLTKETKPSSVVQSRRRWGIVGVLTGQGAYQKTVRVADMRGDVHLDDLLGRLLVRDRDEPTV